MSIKRRVFLLFPLLVLFSTYTAIYSINLTATTNKVGSITSISPAPEHLGAVLTISDTGGSFLAKDEINVALLPIITGQPVADQTICLGMPIILNVTANSSDPTGVLSYAWSLNGSPLADGANISGSQTNALNVVSATLADAGIYTCLITDSFDGNTTSITTRVTISNPTISINPPANTNVCELDSVTLTTTSSGGNVTWDNGISEGVPFLATVTTTYTATITDSNGCSNTDSITINVNNLPTAVSTTVTHPSCTVLTGTVNFSGLPTTGGNWTISNGFGPGINGSSATRDYTGLAAGNYNFTISNGSGCTITLPNITINPAPLVPSAPIVGVPTQTTCTVATGSIPLSGLPTGSWTLNIIGNSTPAFTYSNSGLSYNVPNLAPDTYRFTVTDNNNGCTSVQSSVTTINNQPTIAAPSIQSITQPTCAVPFGSVTLNNLPTGTYTVTRNPGGVTSTGNTSSFIINNIPTGNYTYTVTDTNGCISPNTSVTINAQPATPAPLTASAQDFTGTGYTVNDLTTTSIPVVGATVNWHTTASGGSALPLLTGLTTGTYYVSQSLASCESARTPVTVNVYPNAVGGSVTGGTTVCRNSSASLILTGHTGTVQNWESSPVADFSSGIVTIASTSTSYTVPNNTTSLYYRAVLSSGTTTSNSNPGYVQVDPPSSGGTLSPSTFDVCENNAALGTIILSGYIGNIIRWESSTDTVNWTTIANTTPLQNYISLTQTTYYRAVVQNGVCTPAYSSISTITVNPLPSILNIVNEDHCAGQNLTFGYPIGTTPPNHDYEWTSSAGLINSTSELNITVTQTEDYTLTITNTVTGCTVSEDFTITLLPNPTATVAGNATICEGGAISIGSASVLGSSYFWSSSPAGFSSNVSNPNVTPLVTTTYTLVETSGSGSCTETNNVTITVEPTPIINITGSPNITICETATSHFIGASITNPYATFTWEVLPANAGTLANRSNTGAEFTPSTTGINNGFATVRLNVTDNCGTTTFEDILINIDRQSIANAGSDQIVCGNGTITLNGIASQYVANYSWSIPPGITGTLTPASAANPVYTPSASDITNANILYPGGIPFTLTTISGSNCVNSTDTVLVTIVPEPVISAGPATTTICETNTYTPLTAFVDANTASQVWSTSGDGSFSNINQVTPVYLPGTNDKINGTVTLTLTAFGYTPCSNVTSQTVLTIERNPVITPIADATVCASPITPLNINASIQNPGVILWTSSGNGSFNGTESSAAPIYTPDISDLNTSVTFTLNVQPSSPCGTIANETFIYTINAEPIVDAGGDDTICESQPTYLLNGTVTNAASIEWSSNGSGFFDNVNNEDPIYTFSPGDIANGSVTFTLTGTQTSCTPVTDTVTITIQRNPTVNAGLSQTICQGQSATLIGTATNTSGVTWTRSSGTGTFDNPNTLSPTYNSSSNETGTITFTLVGDPIGPCATPTLGATTTVTVIANPTADAGVDANICEGEDYTISTATATNISGTVFWSAGPSGGTFTGGNTLSPTYTPSANDINNGFATLRLTALKDSPCFSDAIDEMTLTINKIPSINVINPTLDVCSNTAPFEITGVSALDYDTLKWTSSGSGTFSPSDNPLNTTTSTFYNPSASDIASGSVVLTLEAARNPLNCNSSVTNSVTLNFISEPIVEAGPIATICEGITYTTTTATATNYSNVTWLSTGTGTWSNQNDVSNATYTPSATDVANGSVTLSLTATGLTPCFDIITDTVILNLEALPIISTLGTATICESGTTFAISGTSIVNNFKPVTLADWTSSGTGNFTTSGDALNPIYTPTAADIASGSVTLTLTVEPDAPCLAPQNGDIILTFIPEPIADAGINLSQCETPFTISTASATAGTYSSLEWSSASGGSFTGGVINTLNPTYIPSNADILAGTVDLTLTAYPISPCASPLVSTITVTIESLPVITTTAQASICENASNIQVLGTTIINSTSFVYTSTTGTIINNETTLSPTVTPSNTDILNGFIELTIEATSGAACGTSIVTDIVRIPIERNPVVNAGTTQNICEGTAITTTNATASFVDIAGGNLQWTNNGGDGSFTTPANAIITTYQPGPTEISNGIVNLTLTATATTPCATNAVSNVTHTIIKSPTLTVNPAIVSICEDVTYQVQPGQVSITNFSNVDFVTWNATSPGTVSQGGILDLEPIFTPNATDISNGYSDLTITVTPKGACASSTLTETIRVNIDKNATIDAIQTTYTFCEGVSKQLEAIYTNEDASTYNWQIISGTGSISVNNIATPMYIPASDSDTVVIRVSVTGNAPCANVVSKEFTINKIQTPEVTLANNAVTVCSSETSIDLNAVTVTNTTANTTYQWTSSSSSATFSNPNNITSTYTYSAADITNGTVTLRLTATSDATCILEDYDEIVITIIDAPEVTITNPTSEICEGTTFAVNSIATTANASSYLWEPIGASDGTFTNSNDLTLAEYTPGANDVLNGSFTIQLTVTGTATCSSESATTTVTIIPKPIIDTGLENRISCATAPFVITGVTGQDYDSILWTSQSGTPGTFSNPTTLNPTYIPSATEIASGNPIVLRVTAQPIAPCATPIFDDIILNLSPEQIVIAGTDMSICEGETVTLNGSATNSSSVYWTTSSTGATFATTENTTYTPSVLDINNGSVTLTLHAVSDTNCAEVVDNVVITIVKEPTANAGAPVTICEGSSYTLLGSEATVTNETSVLWTLSGGGTITAGTETTLTPTFVPAAGQTGTVTLTLTAYANVTCGAASNAVATKTITIVPNPDVNIPANGIICQGESLTITAAEAIATDYASLVWTSSNGLGTFAPSNTAATTYTPDPTQTGIVTLTLTAIALDGSCINDSADLTLTINPAVVVDAGIPTTICEDETYVVSGASILNGSGVFNWSITGPATITTGTENSLTPQIVPNAGASGVVTLTLEASGPASCPAPISDTVTITINPLPIVDAGAPVEACEGVSEILLSGSGTNGTNYSWTHTGAGTIIATSNPLQPKYIPASADYSNPSGVTTITIFLEATGINSCGNSIDNTTITLYANPVITAGTDLPACVGDTITLNGATASNYSSISWTTSGNGTFDFTTAGGVVNPTYTLGSTDISTVTLTMEATPNVACTTPKITDEITINVTQLPSILVTTNEFTLCAETFTLPDVVTITNSTNYTWTNTTLVSTKSVPVNATTETPSITPTADEINNGFILLTLIAQPTTPCVGTAEETIKINLNAAPTINAGTPIAVCSNTNPIALNFGATVSPSSAPFYWTTNGTGTITASTVNTLIPQYTPGINETGIVTFTLNASNPSPCTGETTDSVTVDIIPLPTVNAGSDVAICEGSSFNITDANALNYTSIQWTASSDIAGANPSSGTFNPISANTINPTYTPSINDITRGYVYLTLKVSNSCGTSSDYMRLSIEPGVGVFAGNNTILCEGDSYTLFDATAANAAGGVVWTSAQNNNGTSIPSYSGGIFSSTTAINPTYTPSVDDINQGYVYLIITGSGSGTCSVDNSSMRIDITKKPSITVTDINICVDTPSITLNSSADNYNTISWSIFSGPGSLSNTSSETPTFINNLPSTTTAIETTVVRAVLTPNGGCPTSETIYKDLTITIQPLPTVEAGDNGAVCYIAGQPITPFVINNTDVINASSQNWSTSGIGTFTTGTPTNYQSLANNCPGTEDLTLTATGVGACSSKTVSDVVTLTINCEAPSLGTITSSSGTIVCAGTSGIVYQVATNPNVTNYNWTVPTGATIVNQSANIITVDYNNGAINGNVAVYASNSCGNGPISTFAVTVDPTPTATVISGSTTVCAGETSVIYTATPITGATSYEWVLIDGSTIITATNTITINFSLTATSGNLVVRGINSCGVGIDSVPLAITVISLPTLANTPTTAICSGDTFTHSLTSSPGVTYSWNRPVQSGIDGSASGSSTTIDEVLVNTTTTTQTAIYTVTLTSTEGCISTQTISVAVDPSPQLTNTPADTEICSGSIFNFNPTSNTSGVILWSRASIAGIVEAGSNNNTTSISETLTNSTDAPITVTYEITLPATANGCSSTETVTVIVNPTPSDAGTIAGITTICANTAGIVYSVPVIANATSYVWSVPSGVTIVAGANTNTITVDYNASAISGDISVYGTSVCGNGLESPPLFITVISPPTLSSSLTEVACSNTVFSYLPTSNTTNVSYSWTRAEQTGISNTASYGNGSINETLINTTNIAVAVDYVFTLTTLEGCSNSETVTVNINPLPQLSSGQPAAICSGDTFTYSPTSTTAGTYTWVRNAIAEINEPSNSGTGIMGTNTISEVLTNNTSNPVTVTYTITLPTTPDGCDATTTIDVVVNPTPTQGTIMSGPTTVCAGSSGHVYTVSPITNATSYLWTLPDGSINTTTSNSLTINFSTSAVSGILTVQGVNSCGTGLASVPYSISVIAVPTLSSPLTDKTCSNTMFTYTPTSAYSNVSFSWTRAVTANILNASASGNNAINEILVNTSNNDVVVDYEYTLTNNSGCSNTETVSVIVNPTISLDFTSNAPVTEICSGENFTFDFSTIINTTPATISSVAWTRNDIAGIISSGINTGVNIISEVLTNTTDTVITVVYELELTPTDPQGCPTTETITVDVNPSPIGAISGGGTTCLNSTDNLVTFTGSNGTSPYTFEYTVNGGLINTITTSLNNNSVKVGSSSSTIGLSTYVLERIIDANGCETIVSGSPSVTLDVYALPVLIITNPQITCDNSTVDLTDAAITAGSDSGLTFTYYTNATATAVYTTPTTATSGTYYIRAENSNGCSIIAPVVVTATSLPIVTVNNAVICEGDYATVTATPTTPGLYNYTWTVPVGASAPGNVSSFTSNVAGTYTVEITNSAIPLCVSLPASGEVVINPLPNATVTASASQVCVDDTATVTFSGSLGTAPYTFEYNINGGTTQTITSAGTEATIALNTNAAGVLNINLISVSDASTTACSQTLTGVNYLVDVVPQPLLTIVNPTAICEGDTVDLQTTIIPFDNGLTYTYWTSISATTAVTNPAAVSSGTYYIKATNSTGCSTIAEVIVTKSTTPIVTVNNAEICENSVATITATPSTSGSYNYNWTVPSGGTNPGNVASFTTAIAGSYSVFITDNNSPNCESVVATGIVTVNSSPTATINSSASEVCFNTPATVTFTGANGTAPYTFEYNINGGASQTVTSAGTDATITLDTSTEGIININLVSVTDASATACSQTLNESVIINVRDILNVEAGTDIEVCAGEEVTLTASGSATSYVWNNGVVDGVPFTPTISTTYIVTGTDSFGCESTDTVTVTIIPTITGTIKSPYDFEVCKDAASPAITFVGSNGTAPYTFTYEITSSLLTTPITGSLTSTSNEATLIPEIPTTTSGTFTVTLTSIASGSCSNGNLIAPRQAFINVLDAGIEPAANNLINVNQTICEGEAINDIIFDISGSPENAFVEGLPENVIGTYNEAAGTLTISGTPNEAGSFNYTVKTSSSVIGCNSEFSGTIDVNPKGTLSLAVINTDEQSVCLNTAITAITYNLGGSAIGATVVFSPYTPTGITYIVNGSNVTILGTPTELGIFNYTVETFSTTNNCAQATKTGSITINESEILLNTGNPNQVVCINTAIDAIEFNINSSSASPTASMVLTGSLPNGVTFNTTTGIISGTPTEGGLFNYKIEASTGCATPLEGQIEVIETLPTVLIQDGLADIEVCEGSEITLTATTSENSIVSYEWFILNTAGTPVSTTETYTFTATTSQTIYVIGTLESGCSNTAQINVILKPAISASIIGINSYEVCKDDTEPTITFTGINGIAPYTFEYAINGIINTITSPNTSDTAVISIPTNITGAYVIELTNVEDSESINCSPAKLLEPIKASVTVLDASVYPQADAEIYQTICEGETISDINFDILGNATNAYAEGLPSGVTSSFANNILTISGTPTVTGVFDYTITTSGLSAVCNATFNATITINENNKITPITETDQTICACDTITPIKFELGGSATGATVSGLPSGIIWSISNNILTISGNSCDAANDYKYTITTQGTCESTSATGIITITAPESLAITNGSLNEIVCVNTNLPNTIQFQSIAGQTLKLLGTLPPGVSFVADPVTGSAVISGTPTLIGTYNYIISSNTDCIKNLEGSIIVEAGAFINLSSGSINQITCVGSPIETLRYKLPLSVTSVDFSPTLPAGINYLIKDGELIISGTPTNTSTETTYVISASNNCGTPASTELKLEVEESPEITLDQNSGDVTQFVCQNSEIDPILFTVSPLGTKIDTSVLPSFITAKEVDANTGLWELTGAPLSTGNFNFEIQTIGNSNCSASLSIQIENLYAAVNVVLDANSGSENQTLCSFTDPIEDIVYIITGSIPDTSIITVNGLPSGINASITTTTTGMLITLSGEASVAGVYEYELVYDNCGTIRTGIIEVSSPISINSKVTQISCTGADAEISVDIFGGVPYIDSSGQPFYNVIWDGPNGFKQNQTTITGLEPGTYTITVKDALGCNAQSETFRIEALEPLYVELLNTKDITGCDDALGCANLDYIGGTGIYIEFLLEYKNPQNQNWKEVSPLNNNYYNICGLEAGLYRVTVTDSGGCKTEPFTFTIENGSEFVIENLVFDKDLCNGENGVILMEVNSKDSELIFTYNGVLVNATSLGNNYYELQISAGSVTNGVVTVTNSDGCSLSKDITLETIDPDFEFTSIEFENFGYFEVNSSIEFTNLNFENSPIYNPNIYTYIEWDFDDNTPFKTFYYPDDLVANENDENIETVFHTYTTDGIYNVTLTLYNSAGCATTITKTIVVGKGASVVLPTVFSPNGDGINDVYRPLFRGVTEISMYIYDSWGNLAYEFTSDDATTLENDNSWGWNGIEPVNTEPKNGNYRCYIVAKTLDKKVIEKSVRFLIIQ